MACKCWYVWKTTKVAIFEVAKRRCTLPSKAELFQYKPTGFCEFGLE